MAGTIRTIKVEDLKNDPMATCDMLNSLFFGMDIALVTAIMCTTLDQACANNDYTSEETIGVYENMLEAAKGAQKVLGMPQKMEACDAE